MKQINPAIATVVNFGVSFLHLNVTENTENPIDEVIPKMKPITELFSVLPNAIIIIPIVARIMEIQTLKLIFSFKNKKASKAVVIANCRGERRRKHKLGSCDVFIEVCNLSGAASQCLGPTFDTFRIRYKHMLRHTCWHTLHVV